MVGPRLEFLITGSSSWHSLEGSWTWGSAGCRGFPTVQLLFPPTVQEANLEKVHLALKANRSPSELDALGAQLMDDIIADCRYFLPVLNVSLFMPCIARALIYLGRDDFFFFFFYFFPPPPLKNTGHLVMFASKVAEPRHGVEKVTFKASHKFPAFMQGLQRGLPE